MIVEKRFFTFGNREKCGAFGCGRVMGLVEMSRHRGLSAALLSKVERNVMYPTLPKLLRIAMVFSVGLQYFFNPEPPPLVKVVRKKDRMRFPESPESSAATYFSRVWTCPVANRTLGSYFVEFQPHPGGEMPCARASRD
jgi:transcriptional regulator with XRE-family HTH domain